MSNRQIRQDISEMNKHAAETNRKIDPLDEEMKRMQATLEAKCENLELHTNEIKMQVVQNTTDIFPDERRCGAWEDCCDNQRNPRCHDAKFGIAGIRVY